MHSNTTAAGATQHQQHTRWTARLIGRVIVLVLVNAMVDTVITAPLFVLPQMLEHFATDQSAWLSSSAMLAGAMWAPLLGRSADIYGKRRVLTLTLLLACTGALVCLTAPNTWIFVFGRILQGAAVAAVFLTVALIRDLCVPRIAMPVVGIVTSGSAALSVVSPFLFEKLAAEFGFRSVFVVSASLSTIAAVAVRALIPELPPTAQGRIDVRGALLLGGGLAGALSYVSVGSGSGWLSVGPLALLVVSVTALIRWFLVSRRIPDPVIDIRGLGRPLTLTLLVVVLGAGAYQSMLQLLSLLAAVSPERQLGYGIADNGALGLLFGLPAIGVMIGGTTAGALASRIGPAAMLAGGVALGTVATLGMVIGASELYAAATFSCLLSLAAGTIVTSGFNTASALASTDRQGVISSMVMVMIAIGAVTLNFIGAAVLNSTKVVVDGTLMNSATGIFSYIAIAACAFLTAVVLAIALLRSQRHTYRRVADGFDQPPTDSIGETTPGCS